MESIWWCQIWMFFNHFRQTYEETKEQYDARKSATDEIFPGYVDGHTAKSRLSYLFAPGLILDGLDLTSWSTDESTTWEMKAVIAKLIYLTNDLVGCYRNFEELFKSGQCMTPPDSKDLCATMWKVFADGSKVFQKVDIELVKSA